MYFYKMEIKIKSRNRKTCYNNIMCESFLKDFYIKQIVNKYRLLPYNVHLMDQKINIVFVVFLISNNKRNARHHII